MTDEPVEVVETLDDDEGQGGYTFGPPVAAKPRTELLRRHARGVLVAVSLITGALLGIFWHTVVTLPSLNIEAAGTCLWPGISKS